MIAEIKDAAGTATKVAVFHKPNKYNPPRFRGIVRT
jgi:hypothetical protein